MYIILYYIILYYIILYSLCSSALFPMKSRVDFWLESSRKGISVILLSIKPTENPMLRVAMYLLTALWSGVGAGLHWEAPLVSSCGQLGFLMFVLSWYCEQHVYILPKLIWWNPNYPENGIGKWSDWHVIRSWGWSHHDGLVSSSERKGS